MEEEQVLLHVDSRSLRSTYRVCLEEDETATSLEFVVSNSASTYPYDSLENLEELLEGWTEPNDEK